MSRADGNALFKQGKYADAIAIYKRCVNDAHDNKVPSPLRHRTNRNSR